MEKTQLLRKPETFYCPRCDYPKQAKSVTRELGIPQVQTYYLACGHSIKAIYKTDGHISVIEAVN